MKRAIKLSIFITLLVALVAFAQTAWAGDYWQSQQSRFSAIAGETLATGDVVAIAAADGKAYKADADSSTRRPAVGVIGKGGASGTTVEIINHGILAGQTAASPGVRLFLSATTPGTAKTSAPANPQVIGWVMAPQTSAASSTTYYIQVTLPASAGAAY